MRDAGALLSNLPALLVIVRSPTQVGKFASVFVQLSQQYLFIFYNSICSTAASIFVLTSNQICCFTAGAAERVQAAI